MGKRGKNQKKSPKDSTKIKLRAEGLGLNDMDDEIDAFHKKRDMIPLDINADVESDEDDDEQPVFDYEGIHDDEEEDEDDDEDEDDYSNLKGLAAKIARQQKYLNEKIGGADDEMHDDEEDDKKKGTVWSSKKGVYHSADNTDFELQSSDEDTPAEEEEEVIRLQKQRAEFLRDEDFGLQSDEQDDSDEEPTIGDMMVKGKTPSKSSKNEKAEGDSTPLYEEVKKDLNALSRDEQMDVLQSSAPELVGLLSELKDAMNQLETHVNPLLSKLKEGDNAKKEGMHYLEVKQLLLLAYCQAITFYLLLKSEGQPVRDHPVIARLVEIKSLLDKTKELDGHIPSGFANVLKENGDIKPVKKPVAEKSALPSDLYTELNELAGLPTDKQIPKATREKAEPVKMPSAEANEKKRKRGKHQEDPVSLESAKMLQYRAALEEKLKLKAGSGSVEPRSDKSKKQKTKKLSGKLETTDDFDDEAVDVAETAHNNGRSSSLTSKVSKFITPQNKTRKGVSGDDDLPERDDLGERRWKHELRVLAGAGIKSVDDGDQPEDEPDSDGADVEGKSQSDESEVEFYNQVKQNRAAKLASKAEKYSRKPGELNEPETTVDGKRHITTQMEKNRGLTRPRKKQIKNPRKKYKLKYADIVKRRKGQVQEIRKPKGPSYDGEVHGINPRVSRSRRLKG